MSKADSQRAHVKRRVRERFGFPIGDDRLEEMADAVRSGRARFVRRQSNRITIWDTEFEERPIRVVYDKRTKQIVTVIRVDENGQESGEE